MRQYERHLKRNIKKYDLETRAGKLNNIVKQRQLNEKEEKEMNIIDKEITELMIKAENNINRHQHNELWSPTLHDAIQKYQYGK